MNRLEAIPSTTRRSVFLVLLLVLALVLVPAGCKEKDPASKPSDQAAIQTAETSKSLETKLPIPKEGAITIIYTNTEVDSMKGALSASGEFKAALDKLESDFGGGMIIICPKGYELCKDGWCWPENQCPPKDKP